MKTMQHPLILARTSQADKAGSDPVIRLKLDKPPHWDWQLTTTADDLPLIQLLDRDGRVLVETTGRVAQRARGTFREGVKFHESFPEPLKEESPPPPPPPAVPTTPPVKIPTGNRNYEGFSTKYGPVSFGFRPRKSSSEATVSSSSSHRRKRHSANESELEISKKEVKRYSAGDYLRQQILEDLSKRNDEEETTSEVARNRYKKVKAYLRSQSDGAQHGNDFDRNSKKEPIPPGKKLTQEDLDKIRRFLQDKIHAKMRQEDVLQRTLSYPAESNTQRDIAELSLEKRTWKRHSDSPKSDEKPTVPKNCRPRKIRSDANIRFGPEESSRNKLENEHQTIFKRNSLGCERKKMYRKTRSDIILEYRLSGSSFGSEKDPSENYPTRRIKSQDNLERSWREYKERKKQERLQKENMNLPAEEDFMKKPRWKDCRETCQLKNCKFCENMQNYVDTLKNSKSEDEASQDRPGTSLQENYIMMEPPKSPLEYDVLGTSSPDFGYNSVSKNKDPNERRDSYASSNVKKSDTFKIVDCGDDDGSSDFCYDYSSKTNEEIAKDYFKRVYELLRRRQEEAKNRLAEGCIDERYEDTSSSNCTKEDEEEGEQIKKRRRRRKIGEEPILGKRDGWKSVNGSSPSCRNGSGQHQGGSSLAKRPRHPPAPPPPPPLASANKENDEPRRREDEAAVDQEDPEEEEEEEGDMGSNLSRHHGHKSLNGRRAQSSGNLCDGSKTINVGKFIVPCPRSSRESKYKFCGSLPNHLDGKDCLDCVDGSRSENNNVITDTICGNLGGTLPHKKTGVVSVYSDDSPTTTLADLVVKHRSDESLDGDPWKYRQEGADLARCRYIESLRKKRGSDAGCPHHQHQHQHQHEWRRNSSTLSRGSRCHRSAELEVASSTSTLPKRRQDSTKRSAPSLGELGDGPTRASRISIDKIDDDLLLKMVRRSSCKQTKQAKPEPPAHPQANGKGPPSNRHQGGKCVDLKLYKLSASGEPLDQGYASERSPEDEHPPSLPGQPFPNIKPESTFRVTLTKSSRGLGLSVSGGGTAGPVRVKRLFPQQPAALSNKLQAGDILLAANDVPLTGLTNYEALEVLRTTSSTVELVVCRLPGGDATASPPGTAPPPPPTRKKDNGKPALTLKIPLNPLPPLDVEPCREFDIEMTKVGGSLGFTLRKADSSALGHYVRALVREPALSDGRIQPGDKIIAVDGEDLSPLSHEEAVALLRKCGPKVKLRLYRDLAQTPVSALSPTEPDHPLRPAKPALRQEAVDMLCDLAVRKLSPGTSSGSGGCPRQSSGGSSNSPRRLRRPATRSSTADTDDGNRNNRTSRASTLSQETSDSDQCSIKTQITNSQPETPGGEHIIDPPALYDVCDSSDSSLQLPPPPPPPNLTQRPSYLGLSHGNGANHPDSDCSDSYAGPVIVTDSDTSNFEYSRAGLSSDEHELPNEPASMPPILSSASSTSTAFSYRNPAYQSANPAIYSQTTTTTTTTRTLLVPEPVHGAHSSEQDIPGKVLGADDPGGSQGLLKWKGVMFAQSDSDDSDGKCKLQANILDSAALNDLHEQGFEVFMVELTRGWNSRLGFSLQQDGDDTVISVVHPDSVAAKDGRLKQGDILIMVNDESVEHMSTANIIDLLRKIRGSIGITVLRRKQDSDAT